MKHNLVETLIGAAVLAAAIWFFVYAYSGRGSVDTADAYTLSAAFTDVTGVGIGSDVRIGGVKVGTVQSITLDPESYEARLNLLIQRDITLPEDSDAAIIGESLLGGKFVALTPGGAEAMLGDGGRIEFTQSSISLEQLLGKFVFSAGGVDNESDDDTDDVSDALSAF